MNEIKLPTIYMYDLSYQQQAYFILDLTNGSWLVNAVWSLLEDETASKIIVDQYDENIERIDADSDIHEYINSDDIYWETCFGQEHYYKLAVEQTTDEVLLPLYQRMLDFSTRRAPHTEWMATARTITYRLEELRCDEEPEWHDKVVEALDMTTDTPPETIVEPIIKQCSCEMNMLMMSGCCCNGL